MSDLEAKELSTTTPEGLRAFYLKNGIDPDEMEREANRYGAGGPKPTGPFGPSDLTEDEMADLERLGWRGKTPEGI